jgi:hypothetical protein
MSMLIIRVYSFGCDEADCQSWSDEYVPTADEPEPSKWARRAAAKAGWTTGPAQLAFCPKHSAPTGGDDAVVV